MLLMHNPTILPLYKDMACMCFLLADNFLQQQKGVEDTPDPGILLYIDVAAAITGEGAPVLLLHKVVERGVDALLALLNAGLGVWDGRPGLHACNT